LTLLVETQQNEIRSIAELLNSVLRDTSHQGEIAALLINEGGPAPKDVDIARSRFDRILVNFPLFSDIGVIDAQGKVVLHTNPEMINTELGDRAYFKAGVNGESYVQNVKSRSNNALTTIISHPVLYDGKFVGVLYGTLNLLALSKISTDTVAVGNTGICYVYDSNGIMLMHPNKAYIGDEDSGLGWVQHILQNKNGRLEYVWNEADKVAYFRDIPEMDWIVVLAVERDDLMAPVQTMLRNNIIIVALAALLVGLIIFITARNIVAALKGCAGFAEHVAAGNLTITPQQQTMLNKTSSRGDEIAILAKSIRTMVENIISLFDESKHQTEEAEKATEEARVAMLEAEEARRAAESARREGMLAAAEQIEKVAAVVSEASDDLTRRINQSEEGAAEQAARASETATAMEEMNSTVMEVARNAEQASEVSTATRHKAEEGAKVVKQALESIQRVQQASLTLKDDMTSLGEHARSISLVMGVISDIADQTNLLALNAAIEAARAGEAGRGFAVVADEVRKLAEKTMASTTDVGAAVRAIQQSADQSMLQVDHTVKVIEEATSLANDSGAALEEIVSMADGTADQVRAIAAASEEQSAASEEINRSVSEVNMIAEETASAMREAADSVAMLAEQAHNLNLLIEDMRKA
ncbi:MAG: methyl-accepting chemotaxis protein, partial [Desulfovibrionaceae bacterium]|nr:methyl-accepting chemotaxis protein [Desulfovibrionaceae bacterium]